MTRVRVGEGGSALGRRRTRPARARGSAAVGWAGSFALVWGLHAGFAPSSARAQQGPALHWVRGPGAEGCIPPAQLAREVEGRLGGAIFASATDAELSLEGHVAPSPAGFRALLQVSNREGRVLGSRVLESPDANCRALDEALVLVIVLTLDPEAGLLGGGIALPADVQARLDDALSQLDHAIENGEVVSDDVPVAPSRVPPTRPPPVPKPPAQRRWSLGLSGGPSFGATPAISGLGGVRVGFQPTGLPLFELSALMVAPSGTSVVRELEVERVVGAAGEGPVTIEGAASLASPPPPAEVRAWLTALVLHVCTPRGPEPRVRVRLCGGLEGGLLRAWSEGFTHEARRFFAHAALSGVGVLEVPLGPRWFASVEFGGLLPLVRPEFVYETGQGAERTVFLTSPVIGRMQLVVGVRLGR